MKLGMFVAKRAQQSSDRADRSSGIRKQNVPAAISARDRDTVQAGGAAATDQDGRSRIDALADGYVLDRSRHGFGRKGKNGGCRVLNIQSERFADIAGDDVPRSCRIKLLATAEEEVR